MNKSLQFVNSTTPNFMTYGELGRTPIDILCIKLRIVNFWNRLISNKKKLRCILYKIIKFGIVVLTPKIFLQN
jgi:hypothetical protein